MYSCCFSSSTKMTLFASSSFPFLRPSSPQAPLRPTIIAATPTQPPQSTSSSSSSSSSSLMRRDATRRMLLAITAATTLLQPFSARSDQVEDDSLQDEQRLVRMFQDTTASVVCIKNSLLVGDGRSSIPRFDGAHDDDDDENVTVEGTGSGFVWDSKGHVVTNYHVIAKYAADKTGRQLCKIFLQDSGGNTFAKRATLIGLDPANDLAVLKVDVNPEKLRPALIGTSHDLHVGQNCYAIGNPYGYEHTLTTGVVSGLGREIPSPNGQSIRGAIQTDASINAGNSGGPLVDSYGHVIGVNTSTFTRKGTGLSSGVNFAIPIDTVVRIVPYLIVYGTSTSNRY